MKNSKLDKLLYLKSVNYLFEKISQEVLNKKIDLTNPNLNKYKEISFSNCKFETFSVISHEINLFDLIELFAHVYCSDERPTDKEIDKIIVLNNKRFKLTPQLITLLNNTMDNLIKP